VSGYGSAFKSLYKDQKKAIPQDLNRDIDQTIEGYKKTIAELKKIGRYQLTEGKKHIRYSGFEELVKMFLLQFKPTSTTSYFCKSFSSGLFASLFIVLMMVTMQRSDNIESLNLANIGWVGDCMVIGIMQSKNDQLGENAEQDMTEGTHIYANPLCPWKCPVLLMAMHVFTTATVGNRLFPGLVQNKRVSNMLRDLLTSLDNSILSLICGKPSDIGTHSFRKGSITYCLGFSGLYHVTDAYLRAGWSLGNVKERYIHQTPGGDQILGRVLSGLVSTQASFQTLPPHFHPEDVNAMTSEDWEAVYPDFKSSPHAFKSVVPLLLASLYYHEDYLRKNLDGNHPIFLCVAMTTTNPTVLKLKERIYICNRYCPDTNMVASGIPQMLVLAEKVERVEKRLEMVETTIVEVKEDVIACIKEIPQAVSDLLRQENQVVDKPVTYAEMMNQTRVNEEKHEANYTRLFGMLESLNAGVSTTSSNICSNLIASSSVTVPTAQTTTYVLHQWKGALHIGWDIDFRVPQDTNITVMWNLYHYGSNIPLYPPYSQLNGKDLQCGNNSTLFSKCKTVIKGIISLAFQNQIFHIEGVPSTTRLSKKQVEDYIRKIPSLPAATVNAILVSGRDALLARLYGAHHGANINNSYTTLHNKLLYWNKHQNDPELKI
jgi:hypothetical protein